MHRQRIGPYVQGVDLGNMITTSGQIPVNPKTGEVPADVAAAQARQSLDNVKAIVEAAGLKVGDIVKTTVFVKDLNDFATVNATYGFFTEHNATFPARSCAEVARLPKETKKSDRSDRCSSLISMEIRAIMPGLSLMTNANRLMRYAYQALYYPSSQCRIWRLFSACSPHAVSGLGF